MKILTFDMENLPMMAVIYDYWAKGVYPKQRVQDGYVASYAARWLGTPTILYDGLDNYGMGMDGEKKVIQSLWHLIDQADAVITFNGARFDMKLFNFKAAKYGLGPTSPVKNIDLYKVVKKHFFMDSFSLDSCCRHFGLPQKKEVEMWKLAVGCMNKDPKSWALMREYNERDVEVTENLYHVLLGWINNHPNHNLYNGDQTEGMACPNCGSHDLHQPRGPYYTATMKYKRYECRNCGRKDIKSGTALGSIEERRYMMK